MFDARVRRHAHWTCRLPPCSVCYGDGGRGVKGGGTTARWGEGVALCSFTVHRGLSLTRPSGGHSLSPPPPPPPPPTPLAARRTSALPSTCSTLFDDMIQSPSSSLFGAAAPEKLTESSSSRFFECPPPWTRGYSRRPSWVRSDTWLAVESACSGAYDHGLMDASTSDELRGQPHHPSSIGSRTYHTTAPCHHTGRPPVLLAACSGEYHWRHSKPPARHL